MSTLVNYTSVVQMTVLPQQRSHQNLLYAIYELACELSAQKYILLKKIEIEH